MIRFAWLALAASLALGSIARGDDAAHAQPPAPAPDPTRFQAQDVFGLEYADDVQISPDGRRIVYVRNGFDLRTDQKRASLWAIDADGENHRPLLADRGSYASPRWSPDGTRIAYVSAADGSPQLFVRWMDSGQTALITDLAQAPDSLAWSPDGRWIAFVMRVPSKQEPLVAPPDVPEGATWAPQPTVIDAIVYRVDGEGYLKPGFEHVFVVPADGGAARQLTSGDFNHAGPPAWSPDGRTLVVSANRNADWEYQPTDADLWAIDVESGKLTQLTSRKGAETAPAFSPDGKRIAYLSTEDHGNLYEYARLCVMEADGSGSHVVLPSFDDDAIDPRWASDGRSLYFLRDERGVRKLAVATLEGRMRDLAAGLGGTELGRPYTSGSFSVSRTGVAAFTVNSPTRPADVAVLSGSATRTLTQLNEDLLGHKKLGAVQSLSWESSHDGREIEGWLWTPPDFDPIRKYPLILEIHGGPNLAYGPNYSTEFLRYLAAGYVVLTANPRGSTSYGYEFANAIQHAFPGHDFEDLMTGVDAALAQGFVDEDNLFVTGGSGGGALTAWIVGKTDRFRAAVAAKPVINFISDALNWDYPNYMSPWWFAKPVWEDPMAYWNRSPLSLAGKVKTPTLLMVGEQDFRTPVAESEQFYEALKLRKVDTLLVRFPEASHDMTDRPSRLIAKSDYVLAWFARHRAGAGAAAETQAKGATR